MLLKLRALSQSSSSCASGKQEHKVHLGSSSMRGVAVA